MVNVYLRDEIMAELIRAAEAENKRLQEQGMRPTVTSAKIIAGIVEWWYLNHKGRKETK